MTNAKAINELSPLDFEADQVEIRGLLLGKGNFVTGGEAWIVTDWEHRDASESKVQLLPNDVFETLLENLDAFGGGEYVLHYQVRARGRFIDGSTGFKPSELAAETEDGLITILFD